MTEHRKKLIEVALPLEAINEVSRYEKSLRNGHPSTLHLWWARRPLASVRAVIFASLVDDPDDPNAPPAFVEACRALDGKDFGYENRNVQTNGDTPRMRLFDFIEKLVTWEASSDERILAKARELIQLATDGDLPPLLDPFAGGGTIPLEAVRLGLEAHAGDLNPVAVLINKAQIEIPPRFANLPPVNPADARRMGAGAWRGAAGLAADVRYYGAWLRERALERIGHLYPTCNGEPVVAWLWARTVKSPDPAIDAHVPLVRSFILSKRKGRECWAMPIVADGRVRFRVVAGAPPKGGDGTIIRNKGARCLITGAPIPFKYIRAEGKAGRMGALLVAIVTDGGGRRNYYSPDDHHAQVAESAQPAWRPEGDIPEQALGFCVQLYGMDAYHKLFTARQLTALTTLSDLVAEARAQIEADARARGMSADPTPLRAGGRGARAYAEAVSVYLAFALDKVADHNSTLCSWRIAGENIRNTFVRQALPMVWDYAEANPLAEASGSFSTAVKYVADSLQKLGFGREGRAYQDDARQLGHPMPLVIATDPPYYDNIGYADLSDFFYVWLRPTLKDVYPELFSTLLTPKEAELIAARHRHGGDAAAAKAFFEAGMFQSFKAMRAVSHLEYPLTIYYAYKQREALPVAQIDLDEAAEAEAEAEASAVESPAPAPSEAAQSASTGWETMLSGLIKAGFRVVGTYPMCTELASRSRARESNALASSVVLVCKPRPSDAPVVTLRGFLDALRRELPAAVHELQSGSIAPVDLAQACIGPGMAIYSRYSQVREADGTPVGVRKALELINAALDEYLAQQEGEFDLETRFAVAWFEQFAFGEGEFGDADNMARAKNISVDGMKALGLLKAEGGKVRLKSRKEYASEQKPSQERPEWQPSPGQRVTVWEAAHRLIAELNSENGGEKGAAKLMEKLPGSVVGESRYLAYRLYNICDRKGWAEHARDYNDLVQRWSGIHDALVQLRNRGVQGELPSGQD